MKLICYSVCLVFLFACGEAPREGSSLEYVAPKPLEELIAPYQLEKKSGSTIEMFENSMVKEGQKLLLKGGDRGFMPTYFNCEECTVNVESWLFNRFAGGSFAFISFENQSDSPFADYAIALSLYYVNSKEGYTPGDLSIWKRIPTEADRRRNSPEELGHDYEIVPVEENIGFAIIH